MNRRELLSASALAGVTATLAASSTASSTKAEVNTASAKGKPLNILILGGTGFTGPHQVRYALSRGHKLTLFNRGRRPKTWPGEVEELTGDRETGDLKALEGRKFDVCIDNPSSTPYWVRDAGKVLAKNVNHYIFISTISVYSDTSKPNMDETGPLAKYDGKDVMAETRASLMANMALYGPLKAECELAAEKYFAKKTTIVRPGLIVGPGDETDRFTYWPARLLRGGDVLCPTPNDPVQFIDSRDLAEWTIRLAEQRALGAFNATGPDYELSTEALLYGIRACTTTGARLRFTTAEFLEANQVQPWAELPVWVPGTGDSAGFARINIDRARAAGLTFRSLADTAQATLDWHKELGLERKLKAGLSPEREAALLKALG